MQPIVIEGTWEEIERRKAELIGQQLRVMILPKKTTTGKPSHETNKSPQAAKPKELRARGMFAGIVSTDEYLREKREDAIREDRFLK